MRYELTFMLLFLDALLLLLCCGRGCCLVRGVWVWAGLAAGSAHSQLRPWPPGCTAACASHSNPCPGHSSAAGSPCSDCSIVFSQTRTRLHIVSLISTHLIQCDGLNGATNDAIECRNVNFHLLQHHLHILDTRRSGYRISLRGRGILKKKTNHWFFLSVL